MCSEFFFQKSWFIKRVPEYISQILEYMINNPKITLKNNNIIILKIVRVEVQYEKVQ